MSRLLKIRQEERPFFFFYKWVDLVYIPAKVYPFCEDSVRVRGGNFVEKKGEAD